MFQTKNNTPPWFAKSKYDSFVSIPIILVNDPDVLEPSDFYSNSDPAIDIFATPSPTDGHSVSLEIHSTPIQARHPLSNDWLSLLLGPVVLVYVVKIVDKDHSLIQYRYVHLIRVF